MKNGGSDGRGESVGRPCVTAQAPPSLPSSLLSLEWLSMHHRAGVAVAAQSPTISSVWLVSLSSAWPPPRSRHRRRCAVGVAVTVAAVVAAAQSPLSWSLLMM